MNYFYIEYMIKDQIRNEHEECHRRRLLKLDEPRDLPSKILESSRIFFKHQGFDNTRIVHICRGLGISRRTFHKYFNSLDEVLEILWAR